MTIVAPTTLVRARIDASHQCEGSQTAFATKRIRFMYLKAKRLAVPDATIETMAGY